MMPLLRLKNIAFTYPRSLPLFTNLSFEIFENEKIYIRGENGAGKTTLFSLIMGLLRPQKGDIIVKGKVIKNQRFGFSGGPAKRIDSYSDSGSELRVERIEGNVMVTIPMEMW